MERNITIKYRRGDAQQDLVIKDNDNKSDATLIGEIAALLPEFKGGKIVWDSAACGRAVQPAAEKG